MVFFFKHYAISYICSDVDTFFGVTMESQNLEGDYKIMMDKALRQAGVKELLEAYGDYQAIMAQASLYLMGSQIVSSVTTNNSTK
jgi:hypothetical protein